MKFCLIKNIHSRVLITISLALLGGLVLLGFVAWPSYKQIQKLNEQIYQERVDLEKLYQKGQILKQTIKEYEEVKPVVGKLNDIYLKRNEELAFITKLEDAAQASNIRQHLTLGLQDPKKPANQLPVQLQINGRLSDFIAYLQALEAMNYYINIDNLRLSKNGSSNTPNKEDKMNGMLEAVLLGLTYYQP